MTDTTATQIARIATLEGFAAHTLASHGVQLRELEPMEVLLVQTRNSLYRIIVSRGTEVTVQGGAFFEAPTAAFIDGSGFGGSLIRIGWVGIGLRMEIRAGERRIITSPVRSIARQAMEQRLH
jgi:hypothetical protein